MFIRFNLLKLHEAFLELNPGINNAFPVKNNPIAKMYKFVARFRFFPIKITPPQYPSYHHPTLPNTTGDLNNLQDKEGGEGSENGDTTGGDAGTTGGRLGGRWGGRTVGGRVASGDDGSTSAGGGSGTSGDSGTSGGRGGTSLLGRAGRDGTSGGDGATGGGGNGTGLDGASARGGTPTGDESRAGAGHSGERDEVRKVASAGRREAGLEVSLGGGFAEALRESETGGLGTDAGGSGSGSEASSSASRGGHDGRCRCRGDDGDEGGESDDRLHFELGKKKRGSKV